MPLFELGDGAMVLGAVRRVAVGGTRLRTWIGIGLVRIPGSPTER